MEGKVIHYKKTFVRYFEKKFKNELDVNFYENRLKSSYYTQKVPKNGFWIADGTSQNITEHEFITSYGDKSVSIGMDRITLIIEENKDKVSIKVYITHKLRLPGTIYFSNRKLTKYITYNKNTKNFYIGGIEKKFKKVISKTVKCNSFWSHPFSDVKLLVRRYVRDIVNHEINKDEFINKGYFGTEISDEIFDVYSKLLYDNHDNLILNHKGNDVDSLFYEIYLKNNGFKYPNNIRAYTKFRISKKELRKTPNLVNVVMSKWNLKGTKIRKILNEDSELDFYLLKNLYDLLGVDYFNKLDYQIISETQDTQSSLFDLIPYRETTLFNLKARDKSKIVNLLNSRVRYSIIVDHIRMIEELKDNFSHNFKMKFSDKDSFNNEHYELSELLQSYKTGEVTRYYGDIVKQNIENIIMSPDGIDYYPLLLTTSADYNNESQIQSNCVRTYIEKPHSLIVSLRQGSVNSNDRATIEYQIRRNDLVRVQSLGKHNKTLSKRYEQPLEILDIRMSKLYKTNVIELPKMTKVFKNGHTIKRNSYFKDIEDYSELNFTELRLYGNSDVLPIWDNTDNFNHDNYFNDFFDLPLV